MQTLTYSAPHHLGKLHAELEAAVPGLAPAEDANGERRARMSISGDGARLELRIPDTVSEADVLAVIDAHDPTPPAPPPDPDAELAAAIQAAGTLEELKAALLGSVRAGRVAGRPL